MAVAFDASTESHTGTSGSTNQASFSLSHNPVGVPKGVLIFVWTNADADLITSVTYDGVNVPQIAEAADTVGEPGRCTAFFLGVNVPTTDPATVVVNRTNNATTMYAVCATVTASGPTRVRIADIVSVTGDGTVAEQSVTDGSPGTNSVRFAAGHFGHTTPPTAGASSTAMQSIDVGAQCFVSVRETTAGQGARNVGMSSGTSDDRAILHLAIAEANTTSLAGTMGALTGALTKAVTYGKSIAGTMGALTGALTTFTAFYRKLDAARRASGINMTMPFRFNLPPPPLAASKTTRAFTGFMRRVQSGTNYLQSVAGTMGALTGLLTKKAIKSFAGTAGAVSGSLVRRTNKALAGAPASLVGVIHKLTSKHLSGTMGALTGALVASHLFFKSLAGAAGALSGVLTKRTNKSLTGISGTLSGTLSRKTLKHLIGTMGSLTGSLVANFTYIKQLSGAIISIGGTLSRKTIKGLSGASGGLSGALSRATRKALAGAAGSLSGALSTIKLRLVSLAGSISPTGTLTRTVLKIRIRMKAGYVSITETKAGTIVRNTINAGKGIISHLGGGSTRRG